jgi:hypothetical protein
MEPGRTSLLRALYLGMAMSHSSHHPGLVRGHRTHARRAKVAAMRADLADLEFSNLGHDPHYASGWFIVPLLLVFVLILSFVL